MTGLPWDASYCDGPAPWDIGRPQPAIVRLASAGAFAGAVLDAGCGTGENALHLASLDRKQGTGTCEKIKIRDFSGIGVQEFLLWRAYKPRLGRRDTFLIAREIAQINFSHIPDGTFVKEARSGFCDEVPRSLKASHSFSFSFKTGDNV